MSKKKIQDVQQHLWLIASDLENLGEDQKFDKGSWDYFKQTYRSSTSASQDALEALNQVDFNDSANQEVLEALASHLKSSVSIEPSGERSSKKSKKPEWMDAMKDVWKDVGFNPALILLALIGTVGTLAYSFMTSVASMMMPDFRALMPDKDRAKHQQSINAFFQGREAQSGDLMKGQDSPEKEQESSEKDSSEKEREKKKEQEQEKEKEQEKKKEKKKESRCRRSYKDTHIAQVLPANASVEDFEIFCNRAIELLNANINSFSQERQPIYRDIIDQWQQKSSHLATEGNSQAVVAFITDLYKEVPVEEKKILKGILKECLSHEEKGKSY